MSDRSQFVVDDVQRAKAALSNIDWSFHPGPSLSSTELSPFNSRKYHWYPATFVPEIPFTLIEVLTSPGATVYDPFSGIGTTYFQALSLNRKPFATDICQVGINFTKNLSNLFDYDYSPKQEKEDIFDKLDNYSDNVDYTDSAPEHILLDQLKPWYSKPDFNEFCFLFQLEHKCENIYQNAALSIAISDALRSHSSQDRGWGCVADNMHPNDDQIMYRQALNGVRNRINTLFEDIEDHINSYGEHYKQIYDSIRQKQNIAHSDVRECDFIPDDSIDLVVSSPPYPEMTDYVAAQRLSYYWLGEEIGLGDQYNEDMNTEIGARRKRGRKTSNQEYLDMMIEANENIINKIAEGGYLCYVLPEINDEDDSRKEVVEDVLNHIKNKNSIALVDDYMRVIPANRRSHNKKWTTLDQERISLFRKDIQNEN